MLERAGELIRAARVPGAVAAVGRGDVTLGTWVTGQADTTGGGRAMTAGTAFDLASLTKVVATTTSVLALAAAGQVGLDHEVRRYLPGTAVPGVTIRQLLAHTSGLPASVTFYQWCADAGQLRRELFATAPQVPPGTQVAYSDLGFMILGEIVAAVTAMPLDAAFRHLVGGPLALASTGYIPLPGPGTQFAAAGFAAAQFAATELRADGTPWCGIVHDENARLLGGVAGHAGLFSTVADLGRFATWWAGDGDGPVPAWLRREAESRQTAGLAGNRGLGWTLAGDRHDILGGAWPPGAVSHTGFTGTSLALDAASGTWVVLLTNGVHYGRDASAVKQLRLDLHRAVAAALW